MKNYKDLEYMSIQEMITEWRKNNLTKAGMDKLISNLICHSIKLQEKIKDIKNNMEEIY